MFMALNVVSGILVSQPTVPFVVRPTIYPGPVRSRVFAGAASSPVMWIQPRPPAPLAADPVVPDVPSEEEEDLPSVSSEVVEPRPPSPPDPVPPAPSSPPVPSASSSTSVSSSLSPDQIALKRLICKSLPQPLNCTLTWSSPEINSLSQSSFSVSLRDFAVSYVSRLIYDYQREVADARKSKCP